MNKRHLALVVIASIALAGCKEISGLFEPSWEVVDTNGDQGAVHFGLNAFDFRIGLPEHVRIERIERRTITKPGGAKEEQERQRQVQVVLARCRSISICDAKPNSDDPRDVTVNPLMLGETYLDITVALDGKETVKDSIKIKVAGH